ncbi:MAG: nucleotidyltransferase family protein [Nitrososphaerota archaeon]
MVSMFSAIVLAAGGSRRMGSNKLLKPLWGRPLISWSVESALASGCDEVIVVLGYEAELVGKALPSNVRRVFNEDWTAGISSSIRRGIEAVAPGSEAAVIMVADQPLVYPAIPTLLASLVLQGGYTLACASLEGDPRNPAAFHKTLFNELLGLEGDKGAKQVITRHLSEAAFLEVPREALIDVDRPEDLARLEKTLSPPHAKFF